MTWWPGWDSIESTAFWSHFWFWFGIACLFALGASEIVSHIYGLRKDQLVAVAETAASAQRKSDADAAETRRKGDVEALQKQLAAAEKSAEDAQKKAASVERAAMARHLTESQQTAIFNAIAQFAGKSVDIVIPMGDNEAKSFAGEFVSIFRKAGWNAGENDGINQAVWTGPPVTGVQVTLNQGEASANRLPPGAEPLIRVLIALGLTEGGFVNPGTQPGKIELRIGSKPLR
jgi:hypothetical protein